MLIPLMQVIPTTMAFLLASALSVASPAQPSEAVIGQVRVQILTPHLVRLELKGPNGFEDRETFTVVSRLWEPVPFQTTRAGGKTLLTFAGGAVEVPDDATALAGARILDSNGGELWVCNGELPRAAYLPGPSEAQGVHVVSDAPRIVPPAWGATPAPTGNTLHPETSGWDLSSDAPDCYFFLPGAGYAGRVRDYLKLTGATPLPPLWAFGRWTSYWHAYTEESALAEIAEFRKRKHPLDVLVIDTDWRVGASHGYQVAENYFPDMARFLRRAHETGVKLAFNDHPEPQFDTALDPREMQYRWDGLTSLLDIALDAWWYDRNWHTRLKEPAPGIKPEVWGMRVFHDATLRTRPEQRPLIMSNAQGIDNGIRTYAPHPAAHRFPIWWTGDTQCSFHYLTLGVKNAVDWGVEALTPYLSEDLGGHYPMPDRELYVRFLQFGALSAVMRPHGTKDMTRKPWDFGQEAEAITTDYTRLRYRLLPTLYSAARRSHEDGTPVLRRLDLEWPEHPEAADPTQYLLGDDLLVAPVLDSVTPERPGVPEDLVPDGFTAVYFAGEELKGEPLLTQTVPQVDFGWGIEAPAPEVPEDHFSARYTARFGPVPETGDYTFVTHSDDGVRLWVDDRLLIERWYPQAETRHTGVIRLERGKTYSLKLEYMEIEGSAACRLGVVLPSQLDTVANRDVWLPPGTWVDLWTGARYEGGQVVPYACELHHMPLLAREGGLAVLADEMDFVGQKPWERLTVEAFVGRGKSATRTLYEDDGASNAYLRGEFAKTELSLKDAGGAATLTLAPRQGSFAGMPARRWTVRLHLPGGASVQRVELDGKPVKFAMVDAVAPMRALPLSGASSPRRSMETLVEVDVPRESGTLTVSWSA